MKLFFYDEKNVLHEFEPKFKIKTIALQTDLNILTNNYSKDIIKIREKPEYKSITEKDENAFTADDASVAFQMKDEILPVTQCFYIEEFKKIINANSIPEDFEKLFNTDYKSEFWQQQDYIGIINEVESFRKGFV